MFHSSLISACVCLALSIAMPLYAATAKDIQGEWACDGAATWEFIKDRLKEQKIKQGHGETATEQKGEIQVTGNGVNNAQVTYTIPSLEETMQRAEKKIKAVNKEIHITDKSIIYFKNGEQAKEYNYTITGIKENTISVELRNVEGSQAGTMNVLIKDDMIIPQETKSDDVTHTLIFKRKSNP